jgi:hypothetical protein
MVRKKLTLKDSKTSAIQKIASALQPKLQHEAKRTEHDNLHAKRTRITS